MTVTAEGQITIPKDLQAKHRLLPGTEVEFVEDAQGRLEVRAASSLSLQNGIESWLAATIGRARGRFTTDELMRRSRGED